MQSPERIWHGRYACLACEGCAADTAKASDPAVCDGGEGVSWRGGSADPSISFTPPDSGALGQEDHEPRPDFVGPLAKVRRRRAITTLPAVSKRDVQEVC